MVRTGVPWKRKKECGMTANDNSDSYVLSIVDGRKNDELRRTTNQVGVSILISNLNLV